jgi:hypothetical protein
MDLGPTINSVTEHHGFDSIRTKKKINPPTRAGFCKKNIVGDQIAIFKSLAARNATFLLALILITSPVARSTIADQQNAQPRDLHPLSLFQVLRDHGDEVFQHLRLPDAGWSPACRPLVWMMACCHLTMLLGVPNARTLQQ